MAEKERVGIAIGAAVGLAGVVAFAFFTLRSPHERPKNDEELVKVVLHAIEDRMPDEHSLAGLSEVEADLMSTVTAKGIIGNGGHFYWYQGMKRADTLRAAAAFERMGQPAAATAMRKSLDAFPGGVPTMEFLNAHAKDLEAGFSPHDHVIWAVVYDLSAAAYIKSRRSDLIAANAELADVLRP